MQDRSEETELLTNFLKNDDLRLMTIFGLGGVGKTALVCHVLRKLEKQNTNNNELSKIISVVYINIETSEFITNIKIFNDLCKLFSVEKAEKLKKLFENSNITLKDKVQELLTELQQTHILLILDRFEKVIDPNTQEITALELNEFLYTLISWRTRHNIKVIIVSQIPPGNLWLVEPGKQTSLPLKGLNPDDSSAYLRWLDSSGNAGLRSQSDDLLITISNRLDGSPRAMEFWVSYLKRYPHVSPLDLLNETNNLVPQQIVENLIDFSRLNNIAKKVMQVLAVFNLPVSSEAVAYVLYSYLLDLDINNVDITLELNRLVEIYLINYDHETKQYSLDRLTRDCALRAFEDKDRSSIQDSRETPSFSRFNLLRSIALCLKKLRELYKKNTEDIFIQLSLALLEFEKWYERQEYDEAALVLLKITPDLFGWGYYRLSIEQYKRLENKIEDQQLAIYTLDSLGHALLEIGQYPEALLYFKQALDKANQLENNEFDKATLLNGLGNCYVHLGELNDAIGCYEKALDMIREHKTDNSEYEKTKGFLINNIGIYYGYLGQIEDAINKHKEAINIAATITDWDLKVQCLTCLGNRYADLGQLDDAIVCYEDALDTIPEQLENQGDKGTILHSLAEILIDKGDYTKAIQKANEGINIGNTIDSLKLKCENNCAVARAYLYSGDIDHACNAALEACQYNMPQNNYFALTLLGIIYLKKGEQELAREKFKKARSEVSDLLENQSDNYKALATKGLILCGLTLSSYRTHVDDAKKTFRLALKNNQARGYLQRILRLFDELLPSDLTSALIDVKAILEATFGR